MGRKCCGFGHRELYVDIKNRMEAVLIDLIENRNVSVFYTGGMGDFDNTFSAVVRGLKKQYSDIEIVLVKPYFTNDINKNKEYYQLNYDCVILPTELMGVYYKNAIKQRNRWMIDNSDIVVTCIYRDFGGAYEAEKYASKVGKEIINLIE